MAIPINRTGEHSLNVAVPRFFFQNEKKNASLRLGSAHGEMLIEFLTKNKIISNFSTNLWPSRLTMKKDQSWSDLRKGELYKMRFFQGPDRGERHSQTLEHRRDACNLQHHTNSS